MFGPRTRFFCGTLLGLIASLNLALSSLSGQQWGGYQYLDPAYVVGSEASPPVSASNDELAQRVADLEKALADLKAKESASAQKAASKFSVNVGGRTFLDSVFFGQSASSRATFGDAQDSVFFRAARLEAFGEGFNVFDYRIMVDFASRDSNGYQSTSFKDVYIGVNHLPLLQRVQIGHFKEPFSLEELTSRRFDMFMERSPANQALVPARNVGIAAYQVSENERMTLAFGGFRQIREDPPYVADDDGGYAFTARATYLPWYDEATKGRGLIHLGLGYSFRDVDDPNYRLRARAETAAGPYLVDTYNPLTSTEMLNNVEDYHLLGPEFALVYGPFSVQTEYLVAFFNRSRGADPTFHGAYIQTSYFLTGEHRPYNRSKGVFDRVKPIENFFRVRTGDGDIQTGWGAWEVAYRYSWLDLDDKDVLGGTTADHTFGLNWYWNPYMRMMFNYVHAQVSPSVNRPNTDLNVFEMRAQVDF